MARALRAWAINRGGKTSVRNLQYGPRTRLVRGISGKPSHGDRLELSRQFYEETFCFETVTQRPSSKFQLSLPGRCQ